MVENPPANAGNTASILGPGRFHMPQSSRALAPQLLSLCSATKEPTATRSPSTKTREWPQVSATREIPLAAMKTQNSQKQINELIKLNEVHINNRVCDFDIRSGHLNGVTALKFHFLNN